MPGLPLNTTAALSVLGRPRCHGEQAGLTKFSRDVRKARRQPGWVTYTYGRITMNSRLTLAGVCLLAAFGLAACGGGGGGSSASMQDDTAMMPGGGMDGDEMEPAAPTAAELFAAAQDARDASGAAATAATDAVEAAMENMDKFSTTAANGESEVARANAQAVLDAQADAVQAVMDAEAAQQSAEDALEDAMEHAADNASLISALEAAIEAAEADVKTATDARDGDDLKAAVTAVQNPGDPTPDPAVDPPKTPADHGQDVAMAIGMALGPTSATDGSGLRVEDENAEPATTVMNVVRMNDHQGKTWAEIVGADNIVDARIVDNAVTKAVKAMSVAGMTLVNATTAGDTADGTQAAATYKGIAGTVFCNGADCMVEEVADDTDTTFDESTTRKLVGSWYFTPTSPMEFYVNAAGETDYSPEENYARFGHWLVVDANGEATVHTYAVGGNSATNTSNLDVTTVNTGPDATELTDTEATYTGTAVGMSLHKEVDAHEDAVKGTLRSGAFTATVNLTAKFHATAPMLGGSITGFTSVNDGGNVDPNWSVSLTETAFTGAAVAAGVANTDGQDGTWTAQGYGPDGGRPVGIFGDFNAHFSDGHASGGYATRK